MGARTPICLTQKEVKGTSSPVLKLLPFFSSRVYRNHSLINMHFGEEPVIKSSRRYQRLYILSVTKEISILPAKPLYTATRPNSELIHLFDPQKRIREGEIEQFFVETDPVCKVYLVVGDKFDNYRIPVQQQTKGDKGRSNLRIGTGTPRPETIGSAKDGFNRFGFLMR